MEKQGDGADLLKVDQSEIDAVSPEDLEEEVTGEFPAEENENPDWWKSDGSNGEVY